MKNLQSKTLTALAAITLVAGIAHAQDKTASPDETALLKLEHDWTDAENRHDDKRLNAILDDNFLATFGTGKAIDKPKYMKNLTDGAIDPTAHQDILNENVVVDGDTAVIVLVNTLKGTRNGKPYDAAYRITVTFIKRGDRWSALALHGNSIKQ
jgi:ketosteroid isomerase-like protein